MSGRQRRGVKFPHAHKHNSDARRASFGEASVASDDADGSPVRLKDINESSAPSDKPQQSDYEKKKANFMVRAWWTLLMIGGFFAALLSGHIYVLCIITGVQVVSFKEVIAIANVGSKARDLGSTKLLHWYWLATTMYFLYGETVIYYFKHIVLVDKVLLPLATHHRFISFALHLCGFIFFVGNLKGGHLRAQFSQFGWTHMALFLIVVQAHFIMNNVLEGLIWFFLPAALVITNDIFAYICGITFGRTQLIKLSPKKTVEGFVGAWIMTVIFGYGLTAVLMRFDYFICPATDLGANVFTGPRCEPNPVFVPRTYSLPQYLFLPAGVTPSVAIAPIQVHTFFWASFASLIAPFGGFFASGLKRTLKIKDFGDSIPGHGGMTDRMDCQFIMGFFAYVYYHTFIARPQTQTVSHILDLAIEGLTFDQQKTLVKYLGKYWAKDDRVEGLDLLQCMSKHLEA